MRFTLRLLGAEVFHVDTDRDQPDKDPDDWHGDVRTDQAVGFGGPRELPIREPGRDTLP